MVMPEPEEETVPVEPAMVLLLELWSMRMPFPELPIPAELKTVLLELESIIMPAFELKVVPVELEIVLLELEERKMPLTESELALLLLRAL